MGITIHDVARRAGVSISTVSRVLNNTTPVSEDKRQRVMEAVHALGYSPNPAALSLLKRETGTVGVVLPYISGEFFAELLIGLDATVQQHDYLLMVSASHRHEPEFRVALKSMFRRVDGLLIMAPELTAEVVHQLLQEDLPVVFMNTPAHSGVFDVFNFDNYGGMYAMTRHLLERGHRRIAFIKGPDGAHDAQDRLRAYRDALAHFGGVVSPTLEFEGDFTIECGHEAAGHILRCAPRPTAIIGANDQSAQGALRVLLKAGVRVPEETALAGFDDIPSARFIMPSLSTVRVPIRMLATRAIERLMVKVKGESRPGIEQHSLTLELVLRESTGLSLPPEDGAAGSP